MSQGKKIAREYLRQVWESHKVNKGYFVEDLSWIVSDVIDYGIYGPRYRIDIKDFMRDKLDIRLLSTPRTQNHVDRLTDNWYVFYNSTMNERDERSYLAHSLGHLLMHPESINCSSSSPYESEASEFAANLLVHLRKLENVAIPFWPWNQMKIRKNYPQKLKEWAMLFDVPEKIVDAQYRRLHGHTIRW